MRYHPWDELSFLLVVGLLLGNLMLLGKADGYAPVAYAERPAKYYSQISHEVERKRLLELSNL